MAILEWIRKRPINIRVLEVVQQSCVFLLLGFMVYVTLKDVGDFFGGGGRKTADPKTEIKFLPPDQRPATSTPAEAPAPNPAQ